MRAGHPIHVCVRPKGTPPWWGKGSRHSYVHTSTSFRDAHLLSPIYISQYIQHSISDEEC